ncbi:MAG: nickel insertion protein [Chloroflexota bacterium]
MAQADNGPRNLLLEATLEDFNPGQFELLQERLIEAGAVDVHVLSALMPASRSAAIVRAVLPVESREQVEEVFIVHSSATSVRAMPLDVVQARVEVRSVATRWGDVNVQLKIWRDRVIEVLPVYEDVVDVARHADAPFRVIYDEAVRYSESFIGQDL